VVYEEGLVVARRINASRYLGELFPVKRGIGRSDGVNRMLGQA